jgi:hypothetical protein
MRTSALMLRVRQLIIGAELGPKSFADLPQADASVVSQPAAVLNPHKLRLDVIEWVSGHV